MTSVLLYSGPHITRRLGPFARAAVWFQGCPFTCKNCIAADSQEQGIGTRLKVDRLAAKIIDIGQEKIEGVTISGGEPFLQIKALSELISELRKHDMGIIVFSGYTLDVLSKRAEGCPDTRRVLDRIDVLIDGVYVDSKAISESMRGSDNQNIHYLSNRYVSERAYFENYKKGVMEVKSQGPESFLVGIPDIKLSDKLLAIKRQPQ